MLSRVWKRLLKPFNDKIEKACLRRDSYLDHVFAHEAEALLEEIPSPNSREARAYLQSSLEQLERVPVNFSLSPNTIKTINRACKERNVIRDCFVNRVLLLLVVNINECEKIINWAFHNDLSQILGDNDRDFICAPLWSGGLSAVSEIVNSDPFWALRNIIGYYREQDLESVERLHACVIDPADFPKSPPGIIGLNCYLPDWRIPNHPDPRESAAEILDGILGEPTSRNIGDTEPESERKKTE